MFSHTHTHAHCEGSLGDNYSEVKLFPFPVCVVPGETPCCHRGMLIMLALGTKCTHIYTHHYTQTVTVNAHVIPPAAKNLIHVNMMGNKLDEEQKKSLQRRRDFEWLWPYVASADSGTHSHTHSTASLSFSQLHLPLTFLTFQSRGDGKRQRAHWNLGLSYAGVSFE